MSAEASLPGQTLGASVRTRLSIMMFLQYAFQGLWFTPFATYLVAKGYPGGLIGDAFGAFAIGCIIAPFIVGMIADRFFSAEKILAVLNVFAAVLLVLAAKYSVGPDGTAWKDAAGDPELGIFYWLLLGHFVTYMPTWALTNTIAMRQMSDPARQFPGVRVMGTIGWIVVGFITLFGTQVNALFNTTEAFEKTATPMYISAGIGLAAAVFSLLLPHTAPAGKHKKVTVSDILGIKALSLLKDRNYLVFSLTSLLIFFSGLFYWTWGNVFLNDSKVEGAMAWQTTGQMTEMLFLFIMPFFFARFGVKKMLIMGIVAWMLRFVCFSYGVWGTSTAALVVVGLALHGPCFDFFFVTGQLYTNAKASKDIQAQAQGMIYFLTFGLGWWLAAKFAGRVVQHYTNPDTGVRDWHTIFLWPVLIAAGLAVFFAVTFWDKMKVGGQGKDELPEPPADEDQPTVPEGDVGA